MLLRAAHLYFFHNSITYCYKLCSRGLSSSRIKPEFYGYFVYHNIVHYCCSFQWWRMWDCEIIVFSAQQAVVRSHWYFNKSVLRAHIVRWFLTGFVKIVILSVNLPPHNIQSRISQIRDPKSVLQIKCLFFYRFYC